MADQDPLPIIDLTNVELRDKWNDRDFETLWQNERYMVATYLFWCVQGMEIFEEERSFELQYGRKPTPADSFSGEFHRRDLPITGDAHWHLDGAIADRIVAGEYKPPENWMQKYPDIAAHYWSRRPNGPLPEDFKVCAGGSYVER